MRSSFWLVLLAFGCAGKLPPGTEIRRPLGEDLLALLPSGASAVLDLDVAQLRDWGAARRLIELLPPVAKQRIGSLGFDILDDIDGAAVALFDLGSEHPRSTLVLRGGIDGARARAGFPGTESDYHQLRVSDGPEESFALIGPRLGVWGSAAEVRRAIDLAQGGTDSLRAAAGDSALREALAHAPTGKFGRPAVLGAVIVDEGLRQRARALELHSGGFDWLAGALAVGDGLDLGLVARAPDDAESQAMLRTARAELTAFRARPLCQLIGAGRFVDPVRLAVKNAELHVGYRLSGARVDELLDRLEALARARPAKEKG